MQNLLISLIVLENRGEWKSVDRLQQGSTEDSHLSYSVPCPPEHNKRLLELKEESFHAITQLENLLTNFAHK